MVVVGGRVEPDEVDLAVDAQDASIVDECEENLAEGPVKGAVVYDVGRCPGVKGGDVKVRELTAVAQPGEKAPVGVVEDAGERASARLAAVVHIGLNVGGSLVCAGLGGRVVGGVGV